VEKDAAIKANSISQNEQRGEKEGECERGKRAERKASERRGEWVPYPRCHARLRSGL